MNERIKEIRLTKSAKYSFITMGLVVAVAFGITAISSIDKGETDRVVNNTVNPPSGGNSDYIPVVVTEEEKLVKPFSVNATIKTYYFDLDDTSSNQENALVYYNGMYSPSTAIDYFYSNVSFDVKAVFEGSIIEKKVDPLYGVTLYLRSSENPALVAVYSSLSDVKVAVGDFVKQGDIIAKAGNNTLNSTMGSHLNFSLLKDNIPINPLNYYGKNVKDI